MVFYELLFIQELCPVCWIDSSVVVRRETGVQVEVEADPC